MRNLLIALIVAASACSSASTSPTLNPTEAEATALAGWKTQVAQLRGTPAIPLFTPTSLYGDPRGWPSILFTGGLGALRSFEISYPHSWQPSGGITSPVLEIVFGELRLLLYSSEGYPGTPLPIPQNSSAEEAFACFRAAFVRSAERVERYQAAHIQVEVIAYTNATDNCIAVVGAPGTIALWESGNGGYALIDERSRHQADGIFNAMLDSFRFLD
jgi:hypothetical protein